MKKKYRNRILFGCIILAGIGAVQFEKHRAQLKRLAERGFNYTAEELLPLDDSIFYKNSLGKKLSDIKWKRGGEVFIRIFKENDTLELYGKHKSAYDEKAKWVLLKTYNICRWSGKLGPKFYEGDKQAPEGFYNVSAKQLNPNSRHHLSFNLGFPNQVERAQGKTGTFLMVHGGCSSIGCYAITDAAVDEVYNVVEAALANGQKQVAVHAFPFHLTNEKLAKHKTHNAYTFWQSLKKGYDTFEKQRNVPNVYACNKQYGYDNSLGGKPLGCSPLKAW
ncbi:MAG: murein L,D-transpeptidase [Rhizobiales bacterium]|nr:murein L,D-transpeptidase [Hyphomicrobiales bacterium]